MKHRRYRRMASLAHYGELSEEDQARLQRHLSRCSDCAAYFQGTLAVLRALPAPPEYPPELNTRILGALAGETLGAVSLTPRPKRWFRPVPRYVLVGGGAAVLLAAGYVVGRLTTSVPVEKDHSPVRTEEAFTDAQVEQVSDYLDRSRTLLIGIVNMPTTEITRQDLAVESAVSRRLVNEARTLKAELRSPQAARARQLISELEVLLLQMANLEASQGGTAVNLVREGVEEGGIMLKITIERMNLDERRSGSGRGTSADNGRRIHS